MMQPINVTDFFLIFHWHVFTPFAYFRGKLGSEIIAGENSCSMAFGRIKSCKNNSSSLKKKTGG